MLKSMLVGVDGSEYGAAAIELAVAWGQRYGATLVGLGVVDQPAIFAPEAVPLGGTAFKEHRDETRLADARQRVETALKAFGAQCTAAGVPCQSLEVSGRPADQILLEAQRFDLIVLGQRTYFHFETQEGNDETLERVVQHSPRPVVAVPPHPRVDGPVVVAYDGSLQAARALENFQGLGLVGAKGVHIVSAHASQDEASARADRAAQYLRFHEISPQVHAVATGRSAAQVLLERVEAIGGSLLVMGAYGQPVLKQFFFGSVTRTVIDKCPVPVFLSH